MNIIKVIALGLIFFVSPIYADNNQTIQINNHQQTCGKNYKKYPKKQYKKHYVKNNKKTTCHKRKHVVVKKTVKKPCVRKTNPEVVQIQQNFEYHQPERVYINPVIIMDDTVQPTVIQPTPVAVVQPTPAAVIQPIKKPKPKSMLSVKAGLHGGSMKMTCGNETETIDLDNSPFVGMDLMLGHSGNVEYGVGALLEFNKNYNDLPLYGFLRYRVGSVNLTGSLGYNMFIMKEPMDNVKVKNGMYYSIGLEGPVNSQAKLFAEYLSYTNNLEVTLCEIYNFDYVYNKFALGIRVDL
jgi:hypothetical protein